MKKLLLTLAVVTATALTMYGQGRVHFDNVYNGGTINEAIRVGTINQGTTGGDTGAFVGGNNYSIQLLWAPVGTYANDLALAAAALGTSAAFPFVGLTGGSPTTDGAGLWDAGDVSTGAAGAYTMMARAWYSAGGLNYDAARQGGFNTGYAIFNLTSTAFPTASPDTIFPTFTVGIVPEPSTFALAGLGAAALLLFRRRK